MLWEFGAVPVPPLISKKLTPKVKTAIMNLAQMGVFTKAISRLTNTKLRYSPAAKRTRRTQSVKNIGEEALEANDSFGVRMANSMALELTLLPHSR